MSKKYGFGPVIFTIEDSFQTSIWNLWKWKLDAYEIQDGENKEADIAVSYDKLKVPNPTELLQERQAGLLKQQVFQTEEQGLLWQEVWECNGAIALQYYVSPDWKKIILLQDYTNSAGMVAFEYLTHILFYAILSKEVLTFHGILMEYEEKGIILSACSGTGKTTHARLWRDKKRAFILNGDRATCYYLNHQWMGFGLPWCGTSGEYMNRHVPIKALVILEQGTENTVMKLSTQEYFREVFPHVQYPHWDTVLTEKVLELLDCFLKEISVYKLICKADYDAVDVLYHALKEI